jgi:hypothetical protein
MTPTAMVVERWPSAPPAHVLFLPGFWLLVPGAVGLVSMTELVGDTPSAIRLQASIISFVGIALGVYMGGALFLAVTAARNNYRQVLERTPLRN